MQSLIEKNKRSDDIKSLEKDVSDISQMFDDLNEIINNQDPLLDSITSQIESTQKNIYSGHDELVEAKIQSQFYNKTYAIIAGGLAITVIGGPMAMAIGSLKVTCIAIPSIIAIVASYTYVV